MSRVKIVKELARLTIEQQQNRENSQDQLEQEADEPKEEDNQEDCQAQEERELLLQALAQMQLNAKVNANFLRESREIC